MNRYPVTYDAPEFGLEFGVLGVEVGQPLNDLVVGDAWGRIDRQNHND